ncbi:hypothetical protein CTRI78_v001742 [Colletotrichum trifolii]|uniref:Uncharacterized protein n=1 Tax=Colletotrichum trifolii TaxID=5466 RepID=A0A4R8RS36_COLTR|nr:hypothetical protein CTRI78_v001742 [Colletotrichum trifolii]
MAPNPLCLAWREQIMDNLRLISGRSAFIDIYTSRHPNKTYTIYAVKVHKGKRQEILSAAGRDLEDAYETLHTKSAQEVHQFVELNGFAFPRGVKSAGDDHSDSGSDSEASTLEASVLSAGSDTEEDEPVQKPKTSRRKKKSKKHVVVSSDEEDEEEEEESSCCSDVEIPRRRHVVPVNARPSYIPAPPISNTQPPPPPPGWRGPPNRIYPRGGGVPPPPLPPPNRYPPAGMRPAHAMPPPPPSAAAAATITLPPYSTPAKPVRLVIRWAGHGERKIVEHCQPSHRAIQRVALSHVRAHWQSFENVVLQEMTPGRLWALGAKVRRVAFGNDMYAISGAAGDDLGMYFKADDIPKFEVEVDHDGSIIPPPAPPAAAHHHGR